MDAGYMLSILCPLFRYPVFSYMQSSVQDGAGYIKDECNTYQARILQQSQPLAH